MKYLALLFALTLGCGIVSGPSPADPTCAYLDQQHLAWTTVATVGGAIGTTAGTVIPLVDQFVDPQDAKDWNLGLGITTAIGGGMSLLGTLMSGSLTQAWTAAGCDGGGAE
jgi:hypothetical protein